MNLSVLYQYWGDIIIIMVHDWILSWMVNWDSMHMECTIFRLFSRSAFWIFPLLLQMAWTMSVHSPAPLVLSSPERSPSPILAGSSVPRRRRPQRYPTRPHLTPPPLPARRSSKSDSAQDEVQEAVNPGSRRQRPPSSRALQLNDLYLDTKQNMVSNLAQNLFSFYNTYVLLMASCEGNSGLKCLHIAEVRSGLMDLSIVKWRELLVSLLNVIEGTGWENLYWIIPLVTKWSNLDLHSWGMI